MTTPPERRTGRGAWRSKATLLVASSVLVFVAAEVALGVCGVSHPVFHQADELTGQRLIPGAEGLQTAEGRAWVRINSAGWRDHERTLAKPAGVFRIAVLGDSYAEALQVEEDETFWAVAEQKLGAPPLFAEQRLEVLNFGVAGYGTGQQLLTLRHRVWQYDPDVVLLAFLTGNDISDNSRVLKGVDYIPYFVFDGGQLRLDTSFRGRAAFRARDSKAARLARGALQFSRTLQLLNRARVNWRAWRRRPAAAPERPAGLLPEAVLPEAGLDRAIYREPTSEVWKDAWQVTEQLIQEMQDECRRHRARFFVVTLSNGVQVLPRNGAGVQAFEAAGIDLFYPDRRLQRLGAELGFPVLNLAPLLSERAQQSGVYLHGFGASLGTGHWNQAGHELAGDLIARWLRRELTRSAAPSTDSEASPRSAGRARG